MLKFYNGIPIEFEKENQHFVSILKEQLNKKAEIIMEFFGLSKVENFKIKIWNNKQDYINHLKTLLGNREYCSWMTAHTFDGNINMLPLKFVKEVEGREDETEQNLAIDVCHEFVHICQQYINPNDSENWFWEMLATNLGNPESYEWTITEFDKYIKFNEIPNMQYLVDNFDKINGYKYVFLMGQYLLKFKPHNQILEYVKNPTKLHKDREKLFSEVKNFYLTKNK